MTLKSMSHEDTKLQIRFVPCQFSDNAEQKRADAKKIFKTFADVDVIGGTEAGEEPLRTFLKQEANKRGFRFFVMRAHWIAVKESILSPRNFTKGYVPVLKSFQGVGKHSDRGVVWMQFTHIDTGQVITVSAGHYLTKGGSPSLPNYEINVSYADKIGKLAVEMGRGGAVFIYMGDQNTRDRVYDTFHDSPLTSIWDEKGKYPDTGHGNIDVIATYDKDRRVEVDAAWVMDDTKIRLYVDHFVTCANLTIKARPALKLS